MNEMKSRSYADIEDGIDGVSKGLTLAVKMARLAMVRPGELRPAAASFGQLWLAAATLG